MPGPYATGLVRAPNKDFLLARSAARYGHHLRMLQRLALPASYDSRILGIVGPVKDQGQCGSCWDFSGTGVVEIAFNLAGIGGGAGTMILSEEYTLSCGKNGGCNGDDNVTVLEWAKSTGLPLTSDYGGYEASPGRCKYTSGMTLYKIQDWGFADSSGGNGVAPTDAIKAAIIAHGCVGAAIAADDAFSNIQGEQVFDRTTSQGIDHDIILVGWDDSKGSKGAWLLRNSWSSTWANGGYCWIGYGVNLVGTEAVWASVTPVGWPPYL